MVVDGCGEVQLHRQATRPAEAVKKKKEINKIKKEQACNEAMAFMVPAI